MCMKKVPFANCRQRPAHAMQDAGDEQGGGGEECIPTLGLFRKSRATMPSLDSMPSSKALAPVVVIPFCDSRTAVACHSHTNWFSRTSSPAQQQCVMRYLESICRRQGMIQAVPQLRPPGRCQTHPARQDPTSLPKTTSCRPRLPSEYQVRYWH
jgi:hypothetical protein